MAKPIPRGLPAPVMSATFPEKFIYFNSLVYLSFNRTNRILKISIFNAKISRSEVISRAVAGESLARRSEWRCGIHIPEFDAASVQQLISVLVTILDAPDASSVGFAETLPCESESQLVS